MDLWIRTQDKKTLMKVNRIEVEENYIVCYEDDNDDLVIYMGEYNSEKRALEVLDEIQKILMFEWDYKDKFSMCRVYIMPEE